MKQPLKKNEDYGMDFQERIRRRMKARKANLNVVSKLIPLDVEYVRELTEDITEQTYDWIIEDEAHMQTIIDVIKTDPAANIKIEVKKTLLDSVLQFFKLKENSLSIRDVKGRDVKFDIKVQFVRWRENNYTYGGSVAVAYDKQTRKISDCHMRIQVPFEKNFFDKTSRDEFKSKIYNVLVHELTHIRQYQQPPKYNLQNKGTDKHYTDYFNDPVEIPTIGREIAEFMKEKLSDQEPSLMPYSSRDIFNILNEIYIFRETMKYLNDKNKKSLLNSIYTELKNSGVL